VRCDVVTIDMLLNEKQIKRLLSGYNTTELALLRRSTVSGYRLNYFTGLREEALVECRTIRIILMLVTM